MSIIPLILSELNTKITEASIKYFLSQAMASILLIFGVNLKFYTQEFLNLENLEIILTSALLIKAGLAPFHF
jgi:NADH-ubiquinone oxidoreductase chain 2